MARLVIYQCRVQQVLLPTECGNEGKRGVGVCQPNRREQCEYLVAIAMPNEW